MREDDYQRNTIWLRQSATFTVNGQTRTLEIGIPLTPGASAKEVEALLGEADAAMLRLGEHLDMRVAAALGTGAAPAPALPAVPVPTPSMPEPESVPSPPAPEAAAPTAPAESHPSPVPEAPERPRGTSRADTHTSAPEPPAPPQRTTAPTHPLPRQTPPAVTSEPGRARPSGPLAEPARARPSGPLPKPSVPAGAADMTRPEFIAAVAQLGLNPKQAMDRLGVRSLTGLHLRESLEVLRRQLMREDAPPPTHPEPASAPAPARAEPQSSPRFFEEEDDTGFTFSLDDGPDDEDDAAPVAGASAAGSSHDADEWSDSLGDLSADLADIPDFDALPPRVEATPAPAAPAQPPAAQPAQPAPASGPLPNAAAATAMQRLGQLRGVVGGGPASAYQRTAYDNIIVGQLSAQQSAALVRGVWRIPPERLSAEQLDALISWGKRDEFVDEAEQVLAALRAERARAQIAAQPVDGSAPPAPRSRSTASRSSNGRGS